MQMPWGRVGWKVGLAHFSAFPSSLGLGSQGLRDLVTLKYLETTFFWFVQVLLSYLFLGGGRLICYITMLAGNGSSMYVVMTFKLLKMYCDVIQKGQAMEVFQINED